MQGCQSRCSGFRVWGFGVEGFRGLGFWVLGSGLYGLGGLGFDGFHFGAALSADWRRKAFHVVHGTNRGSRDQGGLDGICSWNGRR